jgi:hypothetical protein
MKTLTPNESKAVNNARKGINAKAIGDLKAIETTNLKCGFETTMKLAKAVSESTEYFKTKECKQFFKVADVDWTMEQFFQYLGFMERSWCYRLIKANKFADKQGDYLNSVRDTYNLQDFLKFVTDTPTKEKEEFKLKLTFGESKLSINDKDELTSTLTKAQIQAVIVLLKRKMDTMIEG